MKNKVEKVLMAGAAALALSSPPDASAQEKVLVASLDMRSNATSSETVRLQEMTPGVRTFLTKVVGSHFDSGIERWYQSGKVPKAWSNLSVEDLHLLVGYLNLTRATQPAAQLTQIGGLGYLPQAGLSDLIQSGVKELIKDSEYTQSFGGKNDSKDLTWSLLTQKTIYKI